MRFVPALLLLASLGIATLPLSPNPVLVKQAGAQSIEIGGGVQVRGAAGIRVNVRSGPEIQPNNVVARARGGDILRVEETTRQGSFDWYRVATPAGTSPAFEGWIRGDLLTASRLLEQTLPEMLAETDERAEPAEPAQAERVPYELRTDWSRNILALYPAIEGCVRLNSAPPVTVLRATLRSRGLAEVIMSDAAGRRWDCVIRESGGTPIRYDPLSGSLFMRDRIAKEPFFSTQQERPRLDPDCYRFERVTDPSNEAHLGWLYYRTCP